jgi:uncharacterized protein YkwD
MRKIIAIILTLLIVANLTSCEEKQNTPKTTEIDKSPSAKQEIKMAVEEKQVYSKPIEDSSNQNQTVAADQEKSDLLPKVEDSFEEKQTQSCESEISQVETVEKEIPRPLKELEEEVVMLLNAEREKAGVKPFETELTYYDLVLLRAKECEEYWSHTRPNGEAWHNLYYSNPKIKDIKLIGENLGKSFSTAQIIVEALMNSEAHRNNILNPKFTHVCIAVIEMKPNQAYPNKSLYAMAQHFYLKEEL